MVARFVLAVWLLAARAAFAQSERWYMPPQLVDFASSPAKVVAVPDSFRQFSRSEAVFDHAGGLIFSIHNEDGELAIYDADQRLVDTIKGVIEAGPSNSGEQQFAVVAVPGTCDRYHIVYFGRADNDTVILFYATYDTWAPGQLTPGLVVRNQPINLYYNNKWSAAMAVGPMLSDGTRALYVVSRPSLDRFRVSSQEIAFDGVLIETSTPGITSLDDFHSRQIALSPDGSMLAWGDLGVTHLIDLDADDVASTLRIYHDGAKPDHPFPMGGLAFSPDGRKLFATLGEPAANVDLQIGYFETDDPAPGVFTRLSDDDEHRGEMQVGRDGHIYVAGYRGLGRIENPDSDTPTFQPNVIPLAHYTLDRGFLPNQVTGELQAACTSPCANPAVLQGGVGIQGNFELVVPYPGGGIAHYWRDNDAPNAPWRGPVVFGGALGQVDALAMLDIGGGWLDVVARAGSRLAAFRYIPHFGGWLSGGVIANGVTGTPTLAATSLATPLVSGGIAHYVNDWGEWKLHATFAKQHAVSDVSMVRGSTPDRLELVARIDDLLAHATYSQQTWSEPEIFARGVSGAPSLVHGRFARYLDVIAPLAQGGMAQYSRISWFFWSRIEFWLPPQPFGSGVVTSVSAMRTNYNDDIEIVAHDARCGTTHYWRQTSPFGWNGPAVIR